MKCYECKWLDRSVVLTCYPPSYRCTLGLGIHHADHECEYEFVPIVRCKDCKNWKKTTINTVDGEPVYDCPLMNEWGDEDGYCYLGERKEE